MAHTDGALACAKQAGDSALQVWVRGTQSLISRFQGHYAEALTYVEDGLRHPTRGTGKVRILCGIAQCHANLGNSREANRALDLAMAERENATADPIGGLFEFSLAKQHYYAASSLIWLPEETGANRATHDATEAIAMWRQEPAETRSLDDEALAHIYLTTAHLQLGNLDAAASAIRPVLDLPEERRISWIKKQLGRVTRLLQSERYHDSVPASDLYEEIRSVAA